MSDRRSIGYAIAVEAQKAGAELLLTSFGRMMSITQMTAKKLNPVPEILEMDVTKPDDIAAIRIRFPVSITAESYGLSPVATGASRWDQSLQDPS